MVLWGFNRVWVWGVGGGRREEFEIGFLKFQKHFLGV